MHFTPYIRPMLELVAVSSLCGWAACLALGLSLFTPLRAIFVGLAGVVAGWAIWRFFQWPPGPALSDVPLAPSLAGTLAIAFVAEVVREARQTAREIKGPERRQLSVPVAVHAAPGAPPAASAAAARPASESARESQPDESPSPGRNPSLEAR